MADWQFKLELKDVWSKVTNDEIDTVETAGVIVERIKTLHKEISERAENPKDFVDRMISVRLVRLAEVLEDEVLSGFEEYVKTSEDDVECFDLLMADLYDWGDSKLDRHWSGKKMCWINTI
jgi:hypothetical protein